MVLWVESGKDTYEKERAVQRVTKSERAYQEIRRMIITGHFSPDNPWSLRTLAEKFDMSVAPITEAVRMLEQEGILQVKPQQGIMVRQLSLQEIHEYTIMREGIEVQAGRILLLKGTVEEADALHAMAGEITALLQERNFQEADYQDYLFHKELVKRTGMPLLLKQFEQVATTLFLTRDGWNGSAFTRESDKEIGLHEQLIDAIFRGTPESADAAIREHISSAANGIIPKSR